MPKKRKQPSPVPDPTTDLAPVETEIDAQYRRLVEARVRAHKARFLVQFRRLKVVALAAKRIGVDRRTVYKWTASDEAFKADLVEIQEEITDALEAELHKLATGKYTRPLVSAGKLVGYEEIHSETALMALLKAYRPKLYRERTTMDVSSTVTADIKIEKREVTVQIVADAAKLLLEAGAVGSPAGLRDRAASQEQPVDPPLALAKAAGVPKSAA